MVQPLDVRVAMQDETAPLLGTYAAVAYGATGDCQHVSDGAVNSGSAVLTSATGSFTSSDVGKRIVVTNGLAAGTHLYTTIAGYTSPTQVTLNTNATNTGTGRFVSWGTDDSGAIQDAIDAAQAAGGGTVYLPPTPSLILSTLTISGSVGLTLKGLGCRRLAGTQTNSSDRSIDIPVVAPHLSGSVLVVAAANTDAIATTLTGTTVNLQDFGVLFAGLFCNTGYGINADGAVNGGVRDNGVFNSLWQDLAVFGVDGSHYAYRLVNPITSTFTQLQSWGGGCLEIVSNGNGNYGNSVFTSLYGQMFVSGTAHGIRMASTGGSTLNLMAFIRPQILASGGQITTLFPGYGATVNQINSAVQKGVSDAVNVTNTAWIQPDFEQGTQFDSAFGNGTYATPAVYGNPSWATATNPALQAKLDNRAIRRDFGNRLTAAESAGTIWDLLDDSVSNIRWGITTDGTRRLQLPGSVKTLGRAPEIAAGAGIGTTPPTPNNMGTDTGGRVIFGTGTSTAAGALVTYTFEATTTYDAPPVVMLTANNSATQALGLYASSVTATGFTISSTSAPTASQALGTYDVSYVVVGAMGTPQTAAISDPFTRADSAVSLGSAPTGGAWTALGTAVWGISSNQAYKASGGSAPAYIDSSRANGKLDVDITAISGGYGPVFRLTDASNYWVATQTILYKVVASTFTSMATYSAMQANDHVTVIFVGNNILVRRVRSGTPSWIASVSDTFNNTATRHGLYADNATARFDNFTFA